MLAVCNRLICSNDVYRLNILIQENFSSFYSGCVRCSYTIHKANKMRKKFDDINSRTIFSSFYSGGFSVIPTIEQKYLFVSLFSTVNENRSVQLGYDIIP